MLSKSSQFSLRKIAKKPSQFNLLAFNNPASTLPPYTTAHAKVAITSNAIPQLSFWLLEPESRKGNPGLLRLVILKLDGQILETLIRSQCSNCEEMAEDLLRPRKS